MKSNTSQTIQVCRELKKLSEDLSEAQRELEQARRKSKKEKLRDLINDLKLDLGWALLQCGEYEKGLTLYASVTGKDYQERKYNGVATALTELGRYDEAKRVLEYGLRKFPESCALWTGLGILCDILELYFEALKCFDIALHFNYGENSGSLYNKALILTKLGSYGDAVSIIDDLIERYPRDPKYLGEKGYCLLEIGYPQEALKYFQKGMKLYEKSPSVDAGISIYSGLCCAYMDLGMKREAMEISIEGLKRFPDEDPTLYHNVGATFCEMGWSKEAREVVKKGVEIFPDDKELKTFLKDIEDDLDNDSPDGDGLLPLLLIVAALSARKKLKKK